MLDADVLDRIDEIVPPGTNFSSSDAGYQPPMVADPSVAAAKADAARAGTPRDLWRSVGARWMEGQKNDANGVRPRGYDAVCVCSQPAPP